MSVTRRRSNALLFPAIFVAALAGCADERVAPEPAVEPAEVLAASDAEITFGAGRRLATLEWNQVALGMIEKYRPNQQAALRGMAYLTLAQYSAADRARSRSPRPTVTLGAIAGASAAVLTYFHPVDSAAFEAEVRAREAELDPKRQAAFREGESIGRGAAALAVTLASRDRFDAPWTCSVPTGPGFWYSSTVPPTPPALPMLGQVQPFFMGAGSQVRPAPPPAFGSPAFNAAVAEVRRISDTRTARQDSIAKFWAMGTGTLIAGFWNGQAAELIKRGRLGEREAARVLAVMNTAAMDGLIACADAKFTYWLLRPSQADPAIVPAIGLPNFPSYPSNHACFSGAAAYVLGAFFPEERQRLGRMGYEAGLSRLFGGIHYRFDSDAGLEIARKVTRLALQADRQGRLLDLLKVEL